MYFIFGLYSDLAKSSYGCIATFSSSSKFLLMIVKLWLQTKIPFWKKKKKKKGTHASAHEKELTPALFFYQWNFGEKRKLKFKIQKLSDFGGFQPPEVWENNTKKSPDLCR